MPDLGITNAKRQRASSLGQSSKFYTIQINSKTPTQATMSVAGGSGFGHKDASIGSMVSLDRLKRVRFA